MEPNSHLPDAPSFLSPRELAALGLPAKDDPNYLFRLRSIRMEVEKLLIELTGHGDDPWERPWVTCKRCSFKWQPMRVYPAPRQCARCHSSYWMSDPKLNNARKPSDLPNPRWEHPKKRRKYSLADPVLFPSTSSPGMRPLTPPPTKNNGQDLYRFLTNPPSPPSPPAPQQSGEATSAPGVVQSGRTPLSTAPPIEDTVDVEEIQGSNPSTGLTEGDHLIQGSDL